MCVCTGFCVSVITTKSEEHDHMTQEHTKAIRFQFSTDYVRTMCLNWLLVHNMCCFLVITLPLSLSLSFFWPDCVLRYWMEQFSEDFKPSLELSKHFVSLKQFMRSCGDGALADYLEVDTL